MFQDFRSEPVHCGALSTLKEKPYFREEKIPYFPAAQ